MTKLFLYKISTFSRYNDKKGAYKHMEKLKVKQQEPEELQKNQNSAC